MKKLVLIPVIMLLNACGTVFSGTSQTVSFDSNVQGVEVYDNSAIICETPCAVKIRRRQDGKTLVAMKKGYKTQQIPLDTTVNILFLGNIFSLAGATTDAATGGMWQYSPGQFYIYMSKSEETLQKEELKKREISSFILKNYASLRSEAQNQEGEYLHSLYLLTDVNEYDLAELCKTTVTPPLFVNAVIELYEKQQEKRPQGLLSL